MPPSLLAFALAQSLAPAAAEPMAGDGQFLLNGMPLQQATATLVTFVGDCPGDGQDLIQGVSFRSPVAPAPYQRIVISNLSTGGYTDREYDERRPSAEAFSMGLASGQHGSFLSLSEGANRFNYAVRNRVSNTVVGQGEANLTVTVNRVTRSRSFSRIEEKRYCLGDKSTRYGNLNDCPDGLITVERNGICPNGSTRILSLETVRLRGY